MVQGSGFRVQGSGFRVQGAGFRVHGSGSRLQGPGSRVQGPGRVGTLCVWENALADHGHLANIGAAGYLPHMFLSSG